MSRPFPHLYPLLVACLLISVSKAYANGWATIENDDSNVSIDGGFEIPNEYEHSEPSGTVTSLFSGSSLKIPFRGSRVAVFAQGGPYQCGTAIMEIDGKRIGIIQWPFLPVDRQAVFVSDRLPAGDHTLRIIAKSEVAVDFVRVWSAERDVPHDQIPEIPVYTRPRKRTAKENSKDQPHRLAVQPGDHEHTLHVPIEDLPAARKYLVHIPDEPLTNMPLILAIHGVDGTAKGMREYSGFNIKADAEQFIVAYPESPNAWLSGRDHPYLLAIVNDVIKRYRVNPNRVYATGHSAGGFMSHSLGMLHPDIFAAVASVAGGVPPEYFPYPKSNRFSIPVMEVHNKADTVVDYEGVPATVRFWRRFNGVGSAKKIETSDGIMRYERYSDDRTEVVLLHFNDNSDDFGHHWPRRKHYGFEAYDPIWNFFARHSLGGSPSSKQP